LGNDAVYNVAIKELRAGFHLSLILKEISCSIDEQNTARRLKIVMLLSYGFLIMLTYVKCL